MKFALMYLYKPYSYIYIYIYTFVYELIILLPYCTYLCITHNTIYESIVKVPCNHI